MANKYTARTPPDKSVLRWYYHECYLSQTEVAKIFGTTQRVVFRWLKAAGIKSRAAIKRFQKGALNSSWKGKNVTYSAFHYRVEAERGKPHMCEQCGITDQNKRYEWANLTGKYDDINDYSRMCVSCHREYDKSGKNFREKRPNKRKLIDGKQKHIRQRRG